jgi:hypothetical protein
MACKTELCLFDRPIPQIVVQSGSFITHYPQQSPNSNTIDFYINSSEYGYLDLNQATLYIRLRVMLSGHTPTKADSDIAAANYLFYTLFEDAKLYINNTLVEGGDGNYIEKCHTEGYLNYSSDTKNTQLFSIGYDDDENVRWDWVKGSKSVELCGPIRLDLFSQPKYLIPGTSLKLTLRRSKPDYSLHLWGKNVNSKPILVFDEISLTMRHTKVDPSVFAGHQLGLTNQNAIYPFSHGKISAYNIPKGSLSFFKDMIFGDMTLPKFIIIGVVKTSIYNGTYHQKQILYENFDISSICLHRNTDFIERYETNFKDGRYIEAYVKSIIRNFNNLEKNYNVGVGKDEFTNGKTLFTFNLAPDFDTHQMQPAQDGNLRLEIKFNSATIEAANVVIYGVFDDEIQITKTGQVIKK